MRTETAYSEMKPDMESLLRTCQQGDAFVWKKSKELRAGQAEGSVWSIGERDLLRYNGAAYVPPDKALQSEIMKNNHDDAQGGHFGKARTIAAIRRKYYWPALEADVDYYVRTCSICQRVKVHRHRQYGLLKPLPVPSEPFEMVTMDFITGLPPAEWQGATVDAILVIVDPFSKYTIYLPTQKVLSAEGLAKLLIENLVQWITFPQHIVSDRDKLFTSEFWQTMCYYLGIQRRLSTTAHPQTDGQTERQNQLIEHFLRCYANYEQTDWPRWIPLAQNVYNNKELRTKRENIRERLEEAKEAQAKYYNRGRIHREFKIGEQVMLRAKNIASLRYNEKLADRYLGPFRILDTWGTNAYKLDLTPRYRKIHPVFHVSLLEPHYTNAGNHVPPGPVLVDGEPEYTIQEIVRDQKRGRGTEYLVRWKGWPNEEATWEPEDAVNQTEALDIYLRKKAEGHTTLELRQRTKKGRGKKDFPLRAQRPRTQRKQNKKQNEPKPPKGI
ncbi:Transposon Ty3-G Gag-Pol polyprotein [Talaromyces islandicus]|uniref:Transposon Ty3-G Gag-Pol polyprotein n=1 Tax=Talaromyces islandicus TaxID=28573 RepID=A0A0U1MBH3_TALIS|nr:Transposon Ty3-G Gag-Pol polyprotein [Talaromyces islandicus]